MKSKNIIFAVALGIGLLTSCEKNPVPPTSQNGMISFSNTIVSITTQISATVATTISGGRDNEILDKGICWSTTMNPTTLSSKRSGGIGVGAISLTLTGLLPGTSYYARSYFQTKNETVYSDNIPFRTVDYQLATVTTNSVTGITLSSAVGSATVTTVGGGIVSSRGLCWSTSSFPTISNSRIISGTGLGSFTGDIAPLNPGTTYYVRAFATNQAGTAYGAQISFITSSVKPATVSAVSLNSISKNAAAISANVIADGGGPITSKGLCYSSITSLPTTVSNSYTNNGSGIGAAGGTITNLVSGTTYYVRAYAVNSAGISYGAVTTFKTSL